MPWGTALRGATPHRWLDVTATGPVANHARPPRHANLVRRAARAPVESTAGVERNVSLGSRVELA